MGREAQIVLASFIAVCDFSIYAMAQMFAAEVTRGGSPITPEMYGRAVYEIPAVFWITVQMNASITGIVGCLTVAFSSHYARAGWGFVFLGNVFCVALFGLFGSLAEESLLRYVCFGPGLIIGSANAIVGGRLFFLGHTK